MSPHEPSRTSSRTPTRPPTRTVHRRAVVWSAPVIVVAAAAPAVAASTTPSLTWTAAAPATTLREAPGSGTVSLTPQVPVVVPTQFTVAGVPAAQTAIPLTITVGRPPGINIPVGRARGFGVRSIGGSVVAAATNTTVYQTAPIIGQYGIPLTTHVSQLPSLAIGSNPVAIEFGLVGTSTGVAISQLATFPVTLTVTVADVPYTATTSIVVPVGAAIL